MSFVASLVKPRHALLLCALAPLLVAGDARANLLDTTVKSLPVKAPSLGGASVGQAILTVTYTDSAATATATAPSVSLGKGQEFKLEMCAKAHSRPAEYETPCEVKAVDTRGLLGPVNVAAPVVTATLKRPAAGKSAYFSYVLSVKHKKNGSFVESASSWPANGLSAAYVGVPAVGSSTSPAPSSEGMPLGIDMTGGINSGLPDSMCTALDAGDATAPGAGVANSGLGPDAPTYYEVGEPTGEYAGQPPVGVMMLMHGGGWHVTGEGAVAGKRSDADRWRARGWRTLNITYRPCAAGFGDVRWFYDRAREVWGSDLPYCALGASAGGNLALMLAYARPSLACVIDQGGPTDGLSLRKQSTPAGGTDGPRWAYNMLAAAVSPEKVIWYSPGRLPVGGTINARVLFAAAAKDPYTPFAQGTALRDKMVAADPEAYVDLVRLADGDQRWIHAKVSADALATYHQREEDLVRPLLAAGE